MLDMHLGYVLMRRPHGPPFSLDDARPFVAGATVAFGFPDILFTPEDAFGLLLERQRTTGAAVVLGLWPAHSSELMDMVEVEDSGRVRDVLLKPGPTALRFTWLIAVWSREFTDFQHQHLAELEREARSRNVAPSEVSVGHVIQAAVRGGLPAQGVTFANFKYLDIGTPEDLARAVAGWG
jgi:glucose-1-phosphate thymidylyltransferase